jgi:hypothetical protein
VLGEKEAVAPRGVAWSESEVLVIGTLVLLSWFKDAGCVFPSIVTFWPVVGWGTIRKIENAKPATQPPTKPTFLATARKGLFLKSPTAVQSGNVFTFLLIATPPT